MVLVKEGVLEDQPDITTHENYCFKCKKDVEPRDFNNYYKICNVCVENSTGH